MNYQLYDYLSTVLVIVAGGIVAYRDVLMAYVPREYTVLFIVLLGILSQYIANKRVENEAIAKNNELEEVYDVFRYIDKLIKDDRNK